MKGSVRKITRIEAVASGMASCGVAMALSRRSLKSQPAADITVASDAKNFALVPTTCFASRKLCAPMCWPTHMLAAIENPNTPPKSRNINGVGVGSRRERCLAQELTHPNRIDRAV